MNSYPNSMTVGQSFSDYVKGDFDWTVPDTPDWKSIEWERGDPLDRISAYDKYYLMTGELDGVMYEGTGLYSCGELIIVENIERQ